MPYEVSTEVSFSAAHFIAGYQGDCAKMHGHNWRVRATLHSGSPERLPGLTYDFRKLRALLEEVAAIVDHTVLNELPFFKVKNPTAEAIAEWFYGEVAGRLDDPNVSVARVEVWESPLNCATYFKE
ncbi:MAG TPA: 6-carboxytetrahydropterin synthase [bacterium]|nr:6-carboxytetrahydropterin synthase [bacterium]